MAATKTRRPTTTAGRKAAAAGKAKAAPSKGAKFTTNAAPASKGTRPPFTRG